MRSGAVIVNPTKFTDVDSVRAQVTRAFAEHGYADPLWLETTEEDPGAGQTRQAIEAGVEVICALGGDGTVRIVGQELVRASSQIPLGLVPRGTGNLLARNLELPIDSMSAGLRVALTGRDARIDTCLLELVRPSATQGMDDGLGPDDAAASTEDAPLPVDESAHQAHADNVREQHIFLVMAGLGFDAEVMASAPEALKARLGWMAYIVTGLRHLKGPQFLVSVKIDDRPPMRRRIRSVMIGNVGKLQGGMELLPDAVADDGSVDAVLLSPEGLVGWAATIAQLATRRRFGHSRVDHLHGQEVRVLSERPVEIEIDGDTLGPAVAMRVQVQPGSLVVRLPA